MLPRDYSSLYWLLSEAFEQLEEVEPYLLYDKFVETRREADSWAARYGIPLHFFSGTEGQPSVD